MSAQGKEIRQLSAAEYERMCRETCAGYSPNITAEALLFALCRRVYHHIYGYKHDLVFPYAVGPRQELYLTTLQQMVSTAQSEPFDAVEIARQYIPGI